MTFRITTCFYLAILITLFGSAICYLLIGSPPIVGIDDANITQVYAKNLAAGHGYVYTPGYERVEGSTSLLWTLINMAAFSVSERPELLIMVISFVLATGTIFCGLITFGYLSQNFNVSTDIKLWTISYALLGLPAFFCWNVFSFMDVTLWTFLVNALISVIILRIGAILNRSASITLITILPIVMGLTRPEAMALVPTLLVIGMFVEWQLDRSRRETLFVYGLGIMSSVATSGVLAYVRTLYFGVPVPNTYYALVSKNPIDNLKNGISYFANFNSNGAFAEVLILTACGCFIVSVSKIISSKKDVLLPYQALFILSSSSLLIFFLSLIKGGDHFGSFRQYQPIYPLMMAMVCAVILAVLHSTKDLFKIGEVVRSLLIILLTSGFLASSMVTFYKTNDFYDQLTGAFQGRLLGEKLNETVARIPGTRIAVIAAGGVAMTFEGRVLDLMGLNWPLMAHAKQRRSGTPGHSAFEKKIFWKKRPELVLPYLAEKKSNVLHREDFILKFLNGITESSRFKSEYKAVAIPIDDIYILAFARRDWIDKYLQLGTLYLIS